MPRQRASARTAKVLRAGLVGAGVIMLFSFPVLLAFELTRGKFQPKLQASCSAKVGPGPVD